MELFQPGDRFHHNPIGVPGCAFCGGLTRHFKLGFKEPVIERDSPRLSREQLTVWNNENPKPEGGPEFERKLLRWFTDDAEKQIREWQKSPELYRQNLSAAVDVVLGRKLSEVGDVDW